MPGKTKELKEELLDWYNNYPQDIDRAIYERDGDPSMQNGKKLL
ncbi:hypothetical protein [Sinomicrobium weinanense]|nr:hypothetical protein [Sinomicrobium weinanense]